MGDKFWSIGWHDIFIVEQRRIEMRIKVLRNASRRKDDADVVDHVGVGEELLDANDRDGRVSLPEAKHLREPSRLDKRVVVQEQEVVASRHACADVVRFRKTEVVGVAVILEWSLRIRRRILKPLRGAVGRPVVDDDHLV